MPPGAGATPALDPVAADAALGAGARAAGVVGVCTADAALLATLRDAAPDLAIEGVDTPQELAHLIVARACFAVFLDVRTMPGALATLVPALARQFPALPVVAVGTRSEEADVARLIGTGDVYRFLHVPVSLERARTFLGAARRRADELQQRRAAALANAAPVDTDEDDEDDGTDGHATAAAPPTRASPPPPTRAPAAPPADAARAAPPPSNFRAMLFALTALGLVVAAGTTWLSRPEPPPERAPSGDPVVADLVGAASAAATAGDLLAPAGQSAADYYRQALARRPDDTEARASLLALSDRMLSAGERALAGERWAEAEAAASTVALVRPRDPRVLALRDRAEAARAAAEAAEAAPVEPEAGASLPPPSSGNTDERAGFEEARDAPAVPGAARAASTPDAGGAPTASTASATGTAPAVGTAAGAAPLPAIAPSPGIAPAGGTARASAPGSFPSARAPDAASIPPEPAVTASTSRATSATPGGVAEVRTGDPSAVAALSPPASTEREPRTSIVASAASPTPSPRPAALRRIEDAAPVYPTRARARGIEGWVDVAFTVDAAGRVTGARVLSAEPPGAFDEAALEAVRRWRYAPPPAPQDANVRLRFRLDR